MVYVLLVILFFVLSFFAVDEFFKKREAEKYIKKNNSLMFPKENRFQKILKKFNFLKSKEEFLSKQGYPLKLNAIKYYSLKIFLALTFLLSSSINYGNVFSTLIFTLSGYFIIDLYIILNKKDRDSKICTDLLTVSNSLSLQLSANIMLKDSLKKQFELCKNNDFKCAMLKFSTKYELSELDIDEAISELNSKFDLVEMDLFCNSLRQYSKVENIIEVLDNLSEALKEKYMKKIRDGTRNKVLLITLGVIVALGNIILITFYPLFVNLQNGFGSIFS